jgi:hypothetical protein
VDLKVGVSAAEFIRHYNPLVLDITSPKEGGEEDDD